MGRVPHKTKWLLQHGLMIRRLLNLVEGNGTQPQLLEVNAWSSQCLQGNPNR
ncbi:hypothetical protein BABINDRAFT_161270 [Babjeviella inositovora NRRL Y-12698]|uniref:Uncharacterized protein n=1 Tax=Babjeviella inositovora NRRL Y-12698 TaxID=984486 RepID=A0A1E3QS35_9ASCO|nr:uncharacterized protein BABINDRAFT_161270 [Babjeviella inositovora NRRL Y-12698]ODQ80314.1 hypothetical protein BABINDRAFT_161270 [Babjeviella inositovora NRRL Y-12698]